jgi:hypothetical protein
MGKASWAGKLGYLKCRNRRVGPRGFCCSKCVPIEFPRDSHQVPTVLFLGLVLFLEFH